LITPPLVRAPELKNTEIFANFSRKRIEVNSASSERTFDKRFEIKRKFSTNYLDSFFKLGLGLDNIWLQTWSKNAKLDGKTFLLNVGWICR
jgi:hypothetical protein